MSTLRLATFNVENLFARYRFKDGIQPTEDDGFSINDLAFRIQDEASKKITAKAIRAVNADVICLQEVESLPVLDRFNSFYLGGMKYAYRAVIDSFDPRQIDVAVLSRHPIAALRSHREERSKGGAAFLFSRDCLEVDVLVGGTMLTLYLNHFKSMMEGRDATRARRQEQAERVASIIDSRWKKSAYKGNFVVLGDFNDYPEGKTSLTALLDHKGLNNVLTRLPETERWTHYYSGGNSYSQLDYLLLSAGLAKANATHPAVMRRGLPWRAQKVTEERLDGVGENEPKASDHAPLYMDITLI
ncbi:endonuclease/exonuclease/phosphatase [Sulfuricella sp. T08]|uniref:endonuclease/exonuclease/phosphatase family protein n=1 Tax=Sulfuricella sp. T08 TaxID=1632857 RepID=UPI00061798BA|nr:endonuclease/exonuclease/phosphatase family protein [Sulfuricella sp. T08]GAO35411.1 endonuclease/exonuclease/phosphatase [Sulfuricella sp. T08]